MAITVAMLGLSHPHSKSYLETLEVLDEVTCVPVYDPVESIADDIGSKFSKASGAYSQIDMLLAEAKPTHAFVAVRNDLSTNVLLKTIEAGVNVFTEKPVARTAGEFSDVLSALTGSPVELAVAYITRWHPGVQQMRAIYQGGALGRLTSIELRLVTSQVGLRDPKHWLFNRDIAGGGILSWLGCHMIDVARYVTEEEFVSVSAHLSTTSGEAIDVEDTAAVSFYLSGGAVGSLHAGYLHTRSAPGYHGANTARSIHLHGTHGNMRYSFDGPLMLQSVAPGWRNAAARTFDFNLPHSKGYGGDFGVDYVRTFLSSNSDEKRALAGPTDALRVLEILDATYQADQSGKRTEVQRRQMTQ
jgi:predicted dehydrogenase